MAGNAKIGALHVSLGLNSAQFEMGLKNAQNGLSRFSRMSTVAAAAAAGAVTAAFSAVAAAAVRTSREVANLEAEARTAGVAFEEFQRLKYAAAQNQVSIEALTDGLKELNLRANEFVLTGQGSASEVFKRLRYDAQDLAAKLQNPSALFTEIIGKLQKLDTASQIRFADELFGGTGGEQFVRFLQGGADGIERLKAEADQLGLVVGQDATNEAEKFNATMVKLGAITESVALKVGQVAIPSLQELADTVADPRFAESMQTFGSIAVAALNAVAQGAANAGNNIRMLKDALGSVDQMSTAGLEGRLTELGRKKLELDNIIVETQTRLDRGDTLFGINEGALRAQIETTRQQIENLTQQEQEILDLLESRESASGIGGTPGSNGAAFGPIIIGAAKAKEAIEITIPPLNEMQQAVTDVGAAFDNAVSSALSGLISDVIKGGNAFDNLISKVGQLGDQLIDMALNSAIQGLFGNLIGGLFGGGGMGLGSGAIGRGVYGGVGGFFPAFPSFDGGGYTGIGARSGGLDGKGGFMAMLHPNETVNDHSKGQSGGLEMNFNITGSRQDAAEIANVARQEAMKVVREYQSNPYRK